MKELVKELRLHPTLPAVEESSRSLDPERRLQRAGRGRRATTLRKRVRDWRRMSRWLEGARGRGWPAIADDVLCYLEMRAAEPCGRTCYTAALQALAFMEESGGMPVERRLSQNPLVRGAVDEMVLECAAANPEYPPSWLPDEQYRKGRCRKSMRAIGHASAPGYRECQRIPP